MTLNTVPLPFQREGAEQLIKWNGRGLLGDFVGSGKSLQALMVLDRNPHWTPLIIVSPAYLKENWRREVKKHLGLDAAVLFSTTADAQKVKDKRIIVVNYDILRDWLWVLQATKPQFIIADEAQALANEQSWRTWAMQELVRGVPHFIALSATPIESRPIQLFPVLNMIDPKEWPSRHRFGHRYGNPRRNPFSGGWEFKGCSHADELNSRLKNYMIRRLKEDVLKDLPEKIYNTVPLELKKGELREYNHAKNDLVSWVKANVKGDASGVIRAEALQKVNVLRQLTSKLKLPHVIEWVRGFLESGEKLILFGYHREFVETVHRAFLKESVMVRGDTPIPVRQAAFDRFNAKKDCSLLVANIKAAGTGWSASACSSVAFGEFSWVPTDLTQGIGRCHGIGRGQVGIPTTAYFLCAAETSDEKFLKTLKEKEKVVGSVLDGEDWRQKTDSVFDSVLADLMEK